MDKFVAGKRHYNTNDRDDHDDTAGNNIYPSQSSDVEFVAEYIDDAGKEEPPDTGSDKNARKSDYCLSELSGCRNEAETGIKSHK